jgi:hypothetical protein
MSFQKVCLFSVIVLTSFSSCKRDVIQYYTTGITLSHQDNGQPFLQSAGDTVGDSCYVLRLNYTSDQTAYYAIDDKNTYAPANAPVSIEITSLQAFDALTPAGALLNPYFIAGPGINSTAESVVADFPNTQDFYPTHDPDDLWLMTPPASAGWYQFIVKMSFDDGIIVRDTTTSIYLAQ